MTVLPPCGNPVPITGSDSEWAVTGSNRRPPACKAGALPAELTARAPSVYGSQVRARDPDARAGASVAQLPPWPGSPRRTTAEPLAAEELRLLDAWWRAANYLSVGQIYLLDNPLLREPLSAEHIKPRLLGHFGTTPGLNLLYAHLNRAIRARDLERDLHHRAGPRRARRSSRARTSKGRTARSTRTSAATRTGLRRLFRQFSFPGGIPSHVAPETPGLDPRGRRARLRALARVRRRVRQPRPARRLRRRRRRGGDGTARHQLALEQVPQCEDRRRRPADPPPERLQDREPDRARAHPRSRAPRAVRGLRLPAADRLRRRAGRRAPAARGGARRRARRHRAHPARRARGRRDEPAAVADADPAHAEGLDRPEGGRRPAGGGHVALAPGAARGRPRAPGANRRSSRSGCGATGPEELFDEHGALVPELATSRHAATAA